MTPSSLTWPLSVWPQAQEPNSNSALDLQILLGLLYRGTCLQTCLLDGPQPCVVGKFPPRFLDPLEVLCSLPRSLSLSLCLVDPYRIPWMYSGPDVFIAMTGAVDGPCYHPPALLTVFRLCRTSSHQWEHCPLWGHPWIPAGIPTGRSLLLHFLVDLESAFLSV